MTRYFSAREIDTLRVLREGFLAFEEEAGSAGPYWASEEELALYDETFAQRIGWKWDAALKELVARARLPHGAVVCDFGCGTGIAARCYLERVRGVERVVLLDHSPAAEEFAAARVREEFAEVAVAHELEGACDVLLVSHVLDELDERGQAALSGWIERSRAVVWVEPGSARSARALGTWRENLRGTFEVLAPCTHQAACGALGREAWCHSFARPAGEVFTEGKWAEFARELGIDLRSLPYSFLALARPGCFELAGGPNARLLGRPRPTRGRVEFELCRVEGVESLDFLQRTDKRLYKELAEGEGGAPLFDARVDGRRVTELARREQ